MPSGTPLPASKTQTVAVNANPSAQPKTVRSKPNFDIKSFVRKILLASPMFPRLYADVVIASDPNSFEAKILVRNYKKILNRIHERTHTMSHPKSCTHIKVTGVRCASPALRGEQFCYFHQRMFRTVRVPDSRIRHSALLEDEASIQVSLMEVVNALLRGTIELKRAELILRALNTAVRNIKRVKFGLHSDEMVREIPNYPTPPLEDVDEVAAADATRRAVRAKSARETAAILAQYHAELAEQSAKAAAKNGTPATATPANGNKKVATPSEIQPHFGAAVAGTPHGGTANVSPVHVGTVAQASPARRRGDYPGGPELPGRSAVAPKPAPTSPAKATTRKPAASVKAEAPLNGKVVGRAITANSKMRAGTPAPPRT